MMQLNKTFPVLKLGATYANRRHENMFKQDKKTSNKIDQK